MSDMNSTMTMSTMNPNHGDMHHTTMDHGNMHHTTTAAGHGAGHGAGSGSLEGGEVNTQLLNLLISFSDSLR